MSSNTLHRVFEGELYESWYPNSQRVNDPDDEPQRWRVVFMFEKSDARLTNNTDEDILDEAEIVVENWIENYRLREIRAPFCRQHIFGS
ncbi:hypothetical protein N7509_005215 [Penicillium cosmopolitanum]|uniref:Uncharacterized protein n=1 Tax=Penicillium cosmopolitanum TaxID=1131564 RepID=A0A9W9W240_9EURO|nr:uncharacterized protein N7509_005215 [Penicillium cosmopolitanum]KAJ5397102.1 hypothetical protein N7509_005215 [Penicillium cosmopolitanum]